MAGRPKGSGKYNEKNKYKETPIQSKEYEFELGSRVQYVGGLHEKYRECWGTITKRSNKKHRIDYSVLFDDGVEINYIMQKALKPKYEQVTLEDVIDENN